MKKVFALILSLSMLLSSVAFATELNKDVLEGQTTVSLTIDPEANEFVVVIPAAVTIDPETKSGSINIVLKAGWRLVSANSLNIKIKAFANGASGQSPYFILKNTEGTTIPYEIKWKSKTLGGPNTSYDYNNYDLISVNKTSANTDDVTTKLDFYVPSLPIVPGEYVDIITFAVTFK